MTSNLAEELRQLIERNNHCNASNAEVMAWLHLHASEIIARIELAESEPSSTQGRINLIRRLEQEREGLFAEVRELKEELDSDAKAMNAENDRHIQRITELEARLKEAEEAKAKLELLLSKAEEGWDAAHSAATHYMNEGCDNCERAEQSRQALEAALQFYADPATYFAIGFLPDRPCGDFINDFDETEDFGWKPGKLARSALDRSISPSTADHD